MFWGSGGDTVWGLGIGWVRVMSSTYRQPQKTAMA